MKTKLYTMKTINLISLLVLMGYSVSAISVKSPASPEKIELTAVQELKKYLPLTIEELIVDGKKINTIYVAATGKQDEQWTIRQDGTTIKITGGKSRGLLYGVYNFLENVAGVRFWTPTEEFIPGPQKIKLATVNDSGKYFFEMRDIYRSNYPEDNGKTAVRRGLSRNGDRGISSDFGGAFDYAPPYFCHTFDRYIPAAQYLKTNPEFFSLKNGKRIGGQLGGQLCLTNPELRKKFLEKLLENIRATNLKAQKDGIKAPLIYDISHNDNVHFCKCKDCEAFTARENQSGLMVDFVNYLAREVARSYPEVKLQTFAYQYTLDPPKTIKPEKNVIIRLCNTYSNQITGVSGNKVFEKQLKDWAGIANSLYIWDYAIIYRQTGLPFPSEFSYPEAHKIYADNKVKGIFWEDERADRSDMPELKYYLLSKYMIDPYRTDFDSLIKDFMDKYYGAAGGKILEYRKLLKQAATEKKAYISWFPTPGDFRYIDLDTMLKAQKLFAEARKLVGNDPEKLYRVNRAAMGLDRLLGYELSREYIIQHQTKNDGTKFPLDFKAARERFMTTWEQSCKRNGVKRDAKLLERLKKLPLVSGDYKISEKFRNVKHIDIPASEIFCRIPEVKLQPDPEAETGSAIVIDADAKPQLYKYPITMGIYNETRKNGVVSRVINKSEIGGKGYFWYKMPAKLPPADACFMYFSQSWGAQLSINNVGQLDKSKPLDIFVRMKLEGPMYFNGPSAPSRIYLDRIIITQSGAVKNPNK